MAQSAELIMQVMHDNISAFYTDLPEDLFAKLQQEVSGLFILLIQETADRDGLQAAEYLGAILSIITSRPSARKCLLIWAVG